jgi:hypothetical protein
MFLVGWSGFDLGYRREDGRVPLALIDDLEDKLQEIETQAIADKVEGVIRPGIAFLEISNAAYRRLHLTGDEEKNSSSPPSSPSTPSGSTTRRSRKTAGASSKASASSESQTASSAVSKEAGEDKLVSTGKRSFRKLIGDDSRHLVRLYRQQCSGGLDGMQWPDGGSLLDQPVKLVEAFSVIGHALKRFEKGK